MGKSHVKKSEAVTLAKKNVKLIAEKLKGISPEELRQLKSIKAVMSALDEGDKPENDNENCKLKDGGQGNYHSGSDSPMKCGIKFDQWNISQRIHLKSVANLYRKIAGKYFFLPKRPSKSNFLGVFFSFLAFIFYFELHTPPGFTRMWLKWENVDLSSVECTIETPNFAMEIFRPPVSCAFCHNITSVDRVSEISPLDFEKWYAYTGRPVIVTDAMTNWTATSTFTFDFLKSIYVEGSRSLEHLGEDCLFFPYVTEFRSLAEVFNMSQERSKRQWYIGWSNCDAETSHILRQHYQRPYFLPATAESTHADWIFMGTPGHGAHMHIDHVINPSWQAQITGRKRWFLQPPPECLYQCQSFHTDVQPGEIIVLDTNKWYHQTLILEGAMSTTIGSEYD